MNPPMLKYLILPIGHLEKYLVPIIEKDETKLLRDRSIGEEPRITIPNYSTRINGVGYVIFDDEKQSPLIMGLRQEYLRERNVLLEHYSVGDKNRVCVPSCIWQRYTAGSKFHLLAGDNMFLVIPSNRETNFPYLFWDAESVLGGFKDYESRN